MNSTLLRCTQTHHMTVSCVRSESYAIVGLVSDGGTIVILSLKAIISVRVLSTRSIAHVEEKTLRLVWLADHLALLPRHCSFLSDEQHSVS